MITTLTVSVRVAVTVTTVLYLLKELTVTVTAWSRPIQRHYEPTIPAYPLQPPHAGCHFQPTHPGSSQQGRAIIRNKRFFEGWYYRLTLPKENVSFAFIFSIEDPQGSPLSLSCCQIMGPNDEYLIQADTDPTKFWAWKHQQGLGCTFEYNQIHTTTTNTTTNTTTITPTMIDPDQYHTIVKTGFQMTPHRLQGIILGQDGSQNSQSTTQISWNDKTASSSSLLSCQFDMSIVPLSGWGESHQQRSTAGWLSQFAVFEPHWQVTMADARATGTVQWKNSTYTFTNAPFYAEKNWGGAFPLKWYWTQCNSFVGYHEQQEQHKPLSVTAGGGIRKLPGGQTESLGMVSVHYDGIMYEATPWIGTMEWDIAPWGMWNMTGRSTKGERPFEVELYSNCHVPGVVLRVPTEKEGMQYFCRDSFSTNTTLSLWELDWDDQVGAYVRGRVIIDKAQSTQAAVEVGGGPWWDRWKGQSRMKQPFKGLVRFPYRVANWRKRWLSK